AQRHARGVQGDLAVHSRGLIGPCRCLHHHRARQHGGQGQEPGPGRLRQSQAAHCAAGLYRPAPGRRPALAEVPQPLGGVEHHAGLQREAHEGFAEDAGYRRDPVDGVLLADLMARSVTVIGAGIVGVCCALHLQREGFQVRLVEKGEPGRAASFGNSGSFGIASCVPFAMPGVLKKVPRMMLDPDSPLKLRWSHVPSALPWFLRFVANARPSRVEEIARARNSLLAHTYDGYAPLIESADAAKWVSDQGLMMVFESEEAFRSAAYALDLRRRNGVHMDVLDGNEARQMEPALSDKVIKAVSLPDVHRTIDPYRLTEAL